MAEGTYYCSLDLFLLFKLPNELKQLYNANLSDPKVKKLCADIQERAMEKILKLEGSKVLFG